MYENYKKCNKCVIKNNNNYLIIFYYFLIIYVKINKLSVYFLNLL